MPFAFRAFVLALSVGLATGLSTASALDDCARRFVIRKLVGWGCRPINATETEVSKAIASCQDRMFPLTRSKPPVAGVATDVGQVLTALEIPLSDFLQSCPDLAVNTPSQPVPAAQPAAKPSVTPTAPPTAAASTAPPATPAAKPEAPTPEVWGTILDPLDRASKLLDRQRTAQSWGLGTTQGSLERDINRIVAEAVHILVGSEATEFQAEILENRARVAKINEEIRQAKIDRAKSPDRSALSTFEQLTRSSKQTFDAKIRDLETNRAGIENEIPQLVQKFQTSLSAIGVQVSPDDARELLNSLTGAEVVNLSAAYQNLLSITNQLAEEIDKNSSDADFVRQYYAMYVIVLRVLVQAHANAETKIVDEYQQRLERLRAEAEELLSVTNARLREARARGDSNSISVYETNIQVQRSTIDAAIAYRDILDEQLHSIQSARANIETQLARAKNTLDTASLSASLLSLIKESKNQISKVLMMNRPPPPKPFPSALRKRMEELTNQIRVPTS